MTLDAEDRALVERIAAQMAAETVRNVARGTGGAVIAVPVFREGATFAQSEPGQPVLVTPDGDDTLVPAVNATGFTLIAGDRVLVEWNPPHGVYVVNVLRSQSGGEFIPAISGAGGTTDTGWTKTGHWSSIGRRIRVWGRLVFGSGSAVGTSFVLGGLPFPVRSDGDAADGAIGHCIIKDADLVRDYDGRWQLAEGQPGGVIEVASLFATPGFPILASLTSTAPMTWAAGDSILYNVIYDTD